MALDSNPTWSHNHTVQRNCDLIVYFFGLLAMNVLLCLWSRWRTSPLYQLGIWIGGSVWIFRVTICHHGFHHNCHYASGSTHLSGGTRDCQCCQGCRASGWIWQIHSGRARLSIDCNLCKGSIFEGQTFLNRKARDGLYTAGSGRIQVGPHPALPPLPPPTHLHLEGWLASPPYEAW